MARFSGCWIGGIIACTGVILNKVRNLPMSRSDLERIRHYFKDIESVGSDG